MGEDIAKQCLKDEPMEIEHDHKAHTERDQCPHTVPFVVTDTATEVVGDLLVESQGDRSDDHDNNTDKKPSNTKFVWHIFSIPLRQW